MCVGTSTELHKTTKDTTYYTDKKAEENPSSYYEEVKKSSDVQMTRNPAYHVP